MKLWLTLQTITFELASFYLVYAQPMTLERWGAFATTHALACASFTGVCWLLLPKHYKSPVIPAVSFLFLFNYFLPLIGMIGTTCSLLVALYLPRPQSQVTWQECEKAPLPQNPGEVLHTQFGTGALREILLHNTDAERRSLAVTAIRQLPRQHAVPLLQLALKDLTDDVRLLAYASLEGIETNINESISVLKTQYERESSAVKAHELAQQYWELCYLGIAEGILRQHYLQEAEQWLAQSLCLQQTASANLLLGRVLLELNRAEEAMVALDAALKGGLLLRQVAPYLAEAAYLSGDYDTAKEYIAYFPEQKGERLSQIKELWG
ncbi:HEAT repeat domain-containing protein [Photobacterium japonica]|uniref:HEAT repeat domain-containing protein n=1 Tax=Photobacterium japonica TaxID=2910235 RepID=UPI003D0CF953